MTIYESLGLSPNEAKIYETLVEKGESGISDIAVHAKIHRRNAYDAIERLIDKGLCFQIFSASENRYNAVDPDKLKELLGEREQELEKLLPELKKKFTKREAPSEVYIYRGIEGQKNIWRDVLRISKESFFIGARGGWFDPRLDAARAGFFKSAQKAGIKFIQLFDYNVLSRDRNIPAEFPNLEYRFLPEKYTTSSAIHIFGDYVITYSGNQWQKLADDITFFVIRDAALADSYRSWFWYMWEHSTQANQEKKRKTTILPTEATENID